MLIVFFLVLIAVAIFMSSESRDEKLDENNSKFVVKAFNLQQGVKKTLNVEGKDENTSFMKAVFFLDKEYKKTFEGNNSRVNVAVKKANEILEKAKEKIANFQKDFKKDDNLSK